MSTDPITIQVLNPLDRVRVNEPTPLQLLIRCPDGAAAAELRQIASLKPKLAELDTDLFERDLVLGPGEVYRCTVSARFLQLGTHPDPLFFVQVGRDTESRRVRVPTPPIRVVPSLGELQVTPESICTYEHGTKVDVTVTHTGTTRFDDFRLAVGPADAIRAGVSEQRRPAFAPGERLKFTTVTAAEELELTFDAAAGGEAVGPVVQLLKIPPVRDAATTAPFRFLEPRKLTQADVRLHALDEAGERIVPAAGVFPVEGAGAKYRVEIAPAHPHVESVRLRSVSGSVEVADMPTERGAWAFQMVVVTNSLFTAPVALHYDVATPEGPQQGELNLVVRPAAAKLWLAAATAGGALTVKGVTAVLPALANPGDVWSMLGESTTHIDTLWDVAQFLSIPILRIFLWLADRTVWAFQEM